jgi:Tfp pilus assembly protein PilX
MKFMLIRNQSGSVLIFSLIIMLILMMIGLGSARNSTLETHMAANTQDRSRALQSAQHALRTAEEAITSLLDNGDYISVFGSQAGFYKSLSASGSDCTSSSRWANGTASWDDEDSVVVDLSVVSQFEAMNLQDNPRYMIGLDTESDSSSPCYSSTSADGYSDSVGNSSKSVETVRFTITSIGYGAQPNTRVRLQETWTIAQ